MHINDLLTRAVEHGASDLHLKVGNVPMMRIGSDLHPMADQRRLTLEDTQAMAAVVLPESLRDGFREVQEVDVAYSVPGLGRFRCSVFLQRGTIGLVLRVIPVLASGIEELNLPRSCGPSPWSRAAWSS